MSKMIKMSMVESVYRKKLGCKHIYHKPLMGNNIIQNLIIVIMFK